MRFQLFFCLLLPHLLSAQAPETPAETAPPHKLEFLNGDRLSGTFRGITPEGELIWHSAQSRDLIRFSLENLKRVELGEPTAKLEKPATRVNLTNGDSYRGDIVRMDADALVLRTPVAGEVRLRSRMLSSLLPSKSTAMLFEGPGSLEEWEVMSQTNGKWEYRDGTLFTQSSRSGIGRKLENMPNRISIEARVEWRGAPMFQIQFWAAAPANPQQNAHTIMIQNNLARVFRNQGRAGTRQFGHQDVSKHVRSGGADLRLLLDREKKEFVLLMNDELVGQWRDDPAVNFSGTGFGFFNLNNAMLKVSGVRVSEWDGAVTGSREQAELELDLLTTLNGDVFAGSLQRIEENVLHFQNDFASFQVPMDRVGDLAFATPTRAKPRLREGDIQLLLHSGERVTLQISQIQEGRVVAQAEISGEVNLNLDYVKALLINPHDNRHQLKKEDW